MRLIQLEPVLNNSDSLPALGFQKITYNADVFALIKLNEQLLELGDSFFRDNQYTLAVGYQIMVCENDCRTLVSVNEHLRFHGV